MADKPTAEEVFHAIAGDVQCDFCLKWFPPYGNEPLALGDDFVTFGLPEAHYGELEICKACEYILLVELSQREPPFCGVHSGAIRWLSWRTQKLSRYFTP